MAQKGKAAWPPQAVHGVYRHCRTSCDGDRIVKESNVRSISIWIDQPYLLCNGPRGHAGRNRNTPILKSTPDMSYHIGPCRLSSIQTNPDQDISRPRQYRIQSSGQTLRFDRSRDSVSSMTQMGESPGYQRIMTLEPRGLGSLLVKSQARSDPINNRRISGIPRHSNSTSQVSW